MSSRGEELKNMMVRWMSEPNPDTTITFSNIAGIIHRKQYINSDDFKLTFFDRLFDHVITLENQTLNPILVTQPNDDFNTALELLEACSEDLFLSGDDKDLEKRIDTFLEQHRPKCSGNCAECNNVPAMLKEQV